MINALSSQIIFLGGFNSKHKQFRCVKPNKSGQTLVNIAKDLKLSYVNQLCPNRYTREEPVHGTSDILGMAFLSPVLSFQHIFFSIADDHMGSDHFLVVAFLDAASIQQWLAHEGSHLQYFAPLLDNKSLFAVAIADLSKWFYYFPRQFWSEMCTPCLDKS